MGKQMRDVSSPYGAPMGRCTFTEVSGIAPGKCRLFRVNLDGGGYDDGGAYWGTGQPLYCCTGDSADGQEVFRDFCRANNWTAARRIMALAHPGITFNRR